MSKVGFFLFWVTNQLERSNTKRKKLSRFTPGPTPEVLFAKPGLQTEVNLVSGTQMADEYIAMKFQNP